MANDLRVAGLCGGSSSGIGGASLPGEGGAVEVSGEVPDVRLDTTEIRELSRSWANWACS